MWGQRVATSAKSSKTSKSRQAFEAAFEEQARRFSAFDLLGISAVPSTAPVVPPEMPTAVATTVRPLDADSAKQQEKDAKQSTQEALSRPEGLSQVLRTDGLSQYQTVDPLSLGHTPSLSLGQTPASLGQTPEAKKREKLRTDRLSVVASSASPAILLAPLQWTVWCILKEVETSGHLTSYRQIAKAANASIEGVRKAVSVLKVEGGIIAKEIVRGTEGQGFRIKLDREIAFRKGTLREAKAIVKRGLSLGQTPDRLSSTLRTDGLCMYVCNNTNIKQTDVTRLLRIAPPDWRLREQTLIQIADSLPDMTAIEFRLSLTYLVEQATNAKEPIRNHNAWVKAAFDKNAGPLVTEREIEARFERAPSGREVHRVRTTEVNDEKDVDLLRRYLSCEPRERQEIDRIAEEKAAPLLKIVAEDKRAGVLEEARLEALRQFFARHA